jgi:hypothetical protein
VRGYVVKKGKQYYAVIYEGVDPTTGKERRQWHPGGPVKRDAERLVNELVKRKDDGTYRGPDRLTVGEYLTQRWLPNQVSQLSPATFDSYRRNIELHVIPRIGGVPLQSWRPRTWTGFTPRFPQPEAAATARRAASVRSRCASSTPSCTKHYPTPDARAPLPATWPRWPTHPSCARP